MERRGHCGWRTRRHGASGARLGLIAVLLAVADLPWPLAAAAAAAPEDGPRVSRDLPAATQPTVHTRTWTWNMTDAIGLQLNGTSITDGAAVLDSANASANGTVGARMFLGADHPVPRNLTWSALAGPNATVLLQLRFSTDNLTWKNWTGPTGPGIIEVPEVEYRYVEWEATFNRTGNTTLPSLDRVALATTVNRDPVLVTPPAVSGVRSEPVILNGTGSFDPDGDPLLYVWQQVAGPPVTIQNRTRPVADFVATALGTYLINFVLSDGITGSNFTRVTVSIVNRPPMVDAGIPQIVPKSTNAVLNGSATDPDGDPVTLQWAQTTGTRVTLSDPVAPDPFFVAASVGVLTFDLIASDGIDQVRGNTSVSVYSRPPEARLSVTPRTVGVGENATFDGSASRDPDGDRLIYRFTFGDGNASGATAASMVLHAYAQPGRYSASLFVLDADGNVSENPAGLEVEVIPGPAANQPPIAAFTVLPLAGTVETDFTFASASLDPEGKSVNVTWHFGDGSLPRAGSTVTYRYGMKGTYVVTMHVTDPLNATNATSRTLTVGNLPPRVVRVQPAGPAVEATVGELIVFAAGASDPDDLLLTYSWRVGGTGVANATGRVLSWMPEQEGARPIEVAVSDGNATTVLGWDVTVRRAMVPGPAEDGSTIVLAGGLFAAVAAVTLLAAFARRRNRPGPGKQGRTERTGSVVPRERRSRPESSEE